MKKELSPLRTRIIIILFSLFGTWNLSWSQFVVISGGGAPSGNHYSQYLQTKNLTDNLRIRFGFENVDVAFGAGNRSDISPLIADVHRSYFEKSKNGEEEEVNKMEVGNIDNNHEATKENVLTLLNQQSQKNRPLYLLVSDHGMPNYSTSNKGNKYSNNCINLWEFNISAKDWKSDEEGCLSVEELESMIKDLPSSPVIYGMSQCYSGGFHQMTVKTNSNNGLVTVNPNICGFTATTDDLTASGCTSNVDGPNYAGYERFFTKQIIGKDFITGIPTKAGKLKNLYQSHILAALEDSTNDIPLSSSDYYLLEVEKTKDKEGNNRNFSFQISQKKLEELINKYSRISAQIPLTVSEPYRSLYLSNQKILIKLEELLSQKNQDTQRLMNLDISLLKKELVEISKLKSILNEKYDSVELEVKIFKEELNQKWANIFKDPQTRPMLDLTVEEQKIEEILLKEIGVNVNTKKTINYLLSYLSIENPEQELLFSKYSNVRSKKYWNYFNPYIDSSMKGKMNFLNILDSEYTKLENRYRLTRRIFTSRIIQGVLGASIESKSTKILENYFSLRRCESTPFPKENN